MKVQVYLILLLSSVLMWAAAFQGTREVYKAAHTAGVIPNLHIKARLSEIL
jgi:hypothetical protein